MSEKSAAAEVRDSPEADRYEATIGGEVAGFAQYIRTKDLVAFVHTVVEPAFEGRGVGSALVRTSLDEARAAGVSVLAVCPFYSGWIARHPEYQDLLYAERSKVTD
ncbi:GNAT family N-acetyltransferase [Streptomyces sp. NPDC088923]|uniref:GNAT family N-acetyltransferase n=1 Tax=Streptomyces sp. NPDC088923 TaxID=3365913 RepID=UPI0037FE1C4D